MVIEQLSNGILFGVIIALLASGVSLIFSVTRTFNFAHGDMATIGATLAVALTSVVALPLPLGVAIGIAVVILVGICLNGLVLAPLARRGSTPTTILVVSLGFSMIFRYLLLGIVGPSPLRLPIPPQQVQPILGLQITPAGAIAVAIGVIALVGAGLFLSRTWRGRAIIALASNGPLAEVSGVNRARTIRLTWGIAAGLAGVGGLALALTQLVYWDMGFQLLLYLFAGAILGGLGTFVGAAVGGFVIGFVSQMAMLIPYVSEHADLRIAVALIAMIVILLVRPQGIFGRKARVS
ncbi:branched-chain amino acid ABC transporter permease [Microbacterium betulae]|uniref:Branched-chain amino acid ABC transporter permease n=1 Tax=Microbacterium betulae TaxID=2981139 RepID=A0AA97I6F4_9MICO|nr:branched-chain amino acid ABC transporter permease [Microbacterium sp. AB]WOF22562.1 branched-chain amino acid ABC transporter permease [Microbacterium sp. AB]